MKLSGFFLQKNILFKKGQISLVFSYIWVNKQMQKKEKTNYEK